MTHVNHTTRQLRGRGITLIEMMVALAITTFVILVVNQLFNGVMQTVGRGTQAGEILQRSRAFDEQIAGETELIISGGRDPKNNPYDWFGRMVGPKGREAGQPGGFLVVVQRQIQAPVTIEDQLKQIARPVRSDQLMFIYDQEPLFDQSGKKRLPPLAPVNNGTFGGDMEDSVNSEYVRLWYGHVLQLPVGIQATNYPVGSINQIDLGTQNADNPNAVAQDWVLGRHAMFLMKDGINLKTGAPYEPIGIHANGILVFSGLQGPGAGGALWNGLTDVSSITLDDITGTANSVIGFPVNSATDYQDAIVNLGHALFPLLTSAKPFSANMNAREMAPSHTYFMGGVSDFIVEWAGDVVTGENYLSSAAQIAAGPDGELDRDLDGRIKWYTHQLFSNPSSPSGPTDTYSPVTYPVPSPTQYPPYSNLARPRANATFVWQHDGSPQFTPWPWMLRIRYRLHDRRGEFDGRQAFDPVLGKVGPEAGAWFETIIPVNYQGVK